MTSPAIVHVIAIIDLKHGSGDIKYVVPMAASSDPVPSEEPAEVGGRTWIIVRDMAGTELQRAPIAVSLVSCAAIREGADRAEGGLVQRTLRLPEGAAGLDLVIDGRTVDSFDAPTGEATGGGLARSMVATAGPMLEMAVPPSRHRKVLLGGDVAAVPGVSYTVQVKPPAASTWTTLSVGRPTPAFNLDRNQFGGADEVDLRITRNIGFRSDVHLERRMSLEEEAFAGGETQPD